MMRAMFTIAAIAFLASVAATSLPVTFESPCSCRDIHGEHRWAVKNDPSTPPVDASAIQAVTPSDVFDWPGEAEHLTQSSERTGIENNWFALTGRVSPSSRRCSRPLPRGVSGRKISRVAIPAIKCDQSATKFHAEKLRPICLCKFHLL